MDAARSTPRSDGDDRDGADRCGARSSVDEVNPALADLAAAVEGLRLPIDCDVLAGVLSITDRLGAKTSTLIGEVAAAALFEDDGAASMRGWLKDRGQFTQARATLLAKTARRLKGCPVTHMAWRSGLLSGSQVDAIVANLSDRIAKVWVDHEAGLVPKLAELSTADTVRVMRAWKVKAEAIVDGDEPVDRPNEFHLSSTLDGRHVLSGSLDFDEAAVLRAALAEAMPAHNREDSRPMSERQADGLVELARFYLNQHTTKGRKNRPHLNVTVSLEDLVAGLGGYDTETGEPISAQMIAAMACEADVHRVVLNSRGAVLFYGRSSRIVPPDLRNLIAIRDGGCRWPGCDRPAWATEVHHIRAWEHGGPTNEDNLVMLCSAHHHLLHKADWRLVLDRATNVVRVQQDGKPPRFSRPRVRPGTLIG